MEQVKSKKEIIYELQQEILLREGFKPTSAEASGEFGLGTIESAFPNAVFPTGTIHEFINATPEHQAASGGFITGLLKTLMQQGGACLWISTSRTIFPPALKSFGVDPHRFIFIDLNREKDVLWAIEEALKCEGLAAVIGEVRELTFAQSRRLQLAVEKSKVTGFILRSDEQKITSTTCTARWKITPIASVSDDELPGVGFPRWNVELLKVRNGNPGTWQMEWNAGQFVEIREKARELVFIHQSRQAG